MIIFDEKDYAEEILRKGFKTKKRRVYETFILAKYLFYKEFDEKKVKEKIVKFYEKWQEDFDLEDYYSVINRTISYAKNSKLKTGRTVSITKSELDTIQSLDDFREQKLAFVMLVLYKFYGYRKFDVVLEDIYQLAELDNCNRHRRLNYVQNLTKKNLIDVDMKGRRWVNFSDNESEELIKIHKFDNFIWEYLQYCELGKFKKCNECGVIIKFPNGNVKCCKKCARVLQNVQKRAWERKRKSFETSNTYSPNGFERRCPKLSKERE